MAVWWRRVNSGSQVGCRWMGCVWSTWCRWIGGNPVEAEVTQRRIAEVDVWRWRWEMADAHLLRCTQCLPLFLCCFFVGKKGGRGRVTCNGQSFPSLNRVSCNGRVACNGQSFPLVRCNGRVFCFLGYTPNRVYQFHYTAAVHWPVPTHDLIRYRIIGCRGSQ